MSEQEKQLLFSGQLLPISKVASYTPYSAEYLSLLARKGAIPAYKISRDWLTTRQAVLVYVRKQEKKHQKLLNRFERSRRKV